MRTVFISYRRSVGWMPARILKNELDRWGYDAFLDVDSLDAGPFPAQLISQITNRDSLVLVLTPGTLERCESPDDWVRKEIELALDRSLTIIPVVVEGFSFKTVGYEKYLAGKLQTIPMFQNVTLNPEYFDASILKLRRLLGENSDSLGRVDSSYAHHKPNVETPPSYFVASTDPRIQAEEKFATGIGFFIEGEIKKAAEKFIEVVKLAPDFAAAHNHLGLIHLMMFHNTREKNFLSYALVEFDKAIKIDPEDASAFGNRGTVLQYMGKSDEALAIFDEALIKFPMDAVLHYNRGNTYLSMERWNEAIDNYSHAIELDPTYIEAYTNRSNAFASLKNHEASLEDLNFALQLDPNFINALANRADAYRIDSELDLSLADYNHALALEPKNVSVLFGRANIFNLMGKYESVISDLTTILTIDSRVIPVRLFRADIYRINGQNKKAVKDFERVLSDPMLRDPDIAKYCEAAIKEIRDKQSK